MRFNVLLPCIPLIAVWGVLLSCLLPSSAAISESAAGAMYDEDTTGLRQRAEALYSSGHALFVAKGNNAVALQTLLAARKLLDQAEPGDDSLKSEAMHQIGLLYGGVPNYDSSRYYQQAALDMKLRLFKTGVHLSVIRSMNDLAGLYAGVWDYRRSLEMRKEALSFAKQLPLNDAARVEMIKLCNNIGRLYFSLFDYQLVSSYYLDALRLTHGREEKFYSMMVVIYGNLAEYHIRMKDHDQALEYCRRADALFCQYAPQKQREYYWHTVGIIHLAGNKPDSALYYYRLDWALQMGKPGSNLRLIAVAHNSLARAFYALTAYDSAHYHIDRMLEIELRISGMVHSQIVDAYHQKALCYKAQGKHTDAMYCFQQSLAANNYDGDMSTVVSFDHALNSFFEMAQLQYAQYERENDLDALRESLQYFNEADEAVLKKRRLLQAADSKEKFSEQYLPMYRQALIVCEALYRATGDKKFVARAFHFSERVKSLNLLDALQADKAALDAGIPSDWIARENELKRNIASIKSLRDNMVKENKPADIALIAQTDTDIHVLDVALDSLVQQYATHFPNYFDLKFQELTASVEDVQAYCRKERSTVLSYSLVEGALFVFIFSPEGVEMETKILPANFEKMLNRFCRHLAQMPSLDADQTTHIARLSDLAQDGHDLYQLLLPSALQSLQQRLMIIPDGQLAYLSFAALPASPVAKDDLLKPIRWNFLIQERSVYYSYSAATLFQMESKQHSTPPQHNFLGIAPDFSASQWTSSTLDNRLLTPENLRIQNNVKGVDKCCVLMCDTDDLRLTGMTATRDNLMQYGTSYRILHFSTHAFYFPFNRESPFLALSAGDGRAVAVPFYLEDILQLRLNADLVVLNACNTAIGRLSPSEGLVSLGQAFVYAGTKSVFSTLWNMKDNAQNVQLMELFYKNIRQGDTKDIALQKAQLLLLRGDLLSSIEYADPHYWAALIGAGDRISLSL